MKNNIKNNIKNDINWLKENKFVTELGTPDKLNTRNELRSYITQVGIGVQLGDKLPDGSSDMYSSQYLTFEVLEDGTFSFTKDGLSYSLDNGTTWIALSAGSSTPTITAGSKVLWKGDYEGTSSSNYGSFSSTGKFNVSGNIMSLTHEDDFTDKTDLTGTHNQYYGLFENCSNLTNASNLILPATALGDHCYYKMFENCTSLTTAPALPATTLAVRCYEEMFTGCSSLTTAPALPATTLATGCYSIMFTDCTSLTTAPELPATELADYCYSGMFSNCTSLTSAPELPATELADNCYSGMFQGCTNLNYIKALFTTDPSTGDYTTDWVFGVASTGTFVKNSDAAWEVTGNNGVPTGWNVEYCPELNEQYLTFVALEDGTFSFSKDDLSYSLDNGASWTTLSAGSSTPAVTAGSKVLWKGSYKGTSESNYGKFVSTGKFNVSGNVMSLTYGDDFVDKTDLTGSDYCFRGLFDNCSKLTSASRLILPATRLAGGCYAYMFEECSSLTSAPVLPAMTLADDCYAYMFYECTSLTTAPELPATELAGYCYSSMFFGCASLTVVPKTLPAMILADDCYNSMFKECTSLTTAPALPATTLVDYCYSGMFQGCTSLTVAPELPATTLADWCYMLMFHSCTSLTTAPELPATELIDNCYEYMFYGCTSLTQAPALPATVLAESCYSSMFNGCTNLNYIKAMFTTVPSSTYTSNWVNGVSSTGTFVKNAAATWDVTGTSGVPTGWAVETATA